MIDFIIDSSVDHLFHWLMNQFIYIDKKTNVYIFTCDQ